MLATSRIANQGKGWRAAEAAALRASSLPASHGSIAGSAVEGGRTGGRGGLPRSRHTRPLVSRELSQGPARKNRRGAPSREARPQHHL